MHIHDYSVSQIEAVGKEHRLNNFIDDTIKITFMLYYKQNLHLVLLFGLCGVLVHQQLLSCLKESVADPIWVQSAIATVNYVACVECTTTGGV